NMKIVHMDFFNSKLEFFISRSSKNKYIMNMYFRLKSYNNLIENEKEFIDSVNDLNLDFLKSVSLDQDNNHVLDMTLIFLIDKNKIDEFIKNLFYTNYIKIIEFIIDNVSVYADDYKKFNEEINILLDHRNFVEEITYKEYKKIMTKEMFIKEQLIMKISTNKELLGKKVTPLGFKQLNNLYKYHDYVYLRIPEIFNVFDKYQFKDDKFVYLKTEIKPST